MAGGPAGRLGGSGTAGRALAGAADLADRSARAARANWPILLGLGALGGIGVFALTRARRPGYGPQSVQRVVVLGAGFAGLTAAREISQRAGRRAHVTLVDQNNYHLFTPLAYQVATCGVDPFAVAFPVRQLAGPCGITFRRGRVDDVDLAGRQVRLDSGDLPYDYLVIALGSTTSFFHNEGALANALPLKSLEDGVAIRQRVIDALESAGQATDDARGALLTFTVVGGGATGVETAAALADMLARVIPREYPLLDVKQARIVLVESEGKLLGHMSDRLASLALDRLRAGGVEVWLNAKARDVTPEQVTTEDGRTVATRTVVWATGVEAPPVVAGLAVGHGKGGSLAVDDCLRLKDYPDVYAVGDCAHVEDTRTHEAVPLLAQSAEQEGAAAGRNIARVIDGRQPVPFRFRKLGEAVSLGRTNGAIEAGGVVLDGLLGGLGWRAIHLARSIGLRNRLVTAVDWGIDFLQEQDTAMLNLHPARSTAERGGAKDQDAERKAA